MRVVFGCFGLAKQPIRSAVTFIHRKHANAPAKPKPSWLGGSTLPCPGPDLQAEEGPRILNFPNRSRNRILCRRIDIFVLERALIENARCERSGHDDSNDSKRSQLF